MGDPVKVVLSKSEAERVQKLGAYFREYLHGWLAQVIPGVKFSPGVARELALAFAEMAGAVVLSLPQVDDRVIEADAIAMAREFVARLEAAAGAPT